MEGKKGMRRLAAILAMLLMAGCANSSGGGEGEIVRPNELILAVGTEPESGFDPITGWGRYGSPLFQSTLFQRDHELNIVGDLAENYEVSEDGTVWTVRLRQDAYFTDGEPVTAEDVRFTFETAAKSGSVIDLTNLQSVETKGEHTVVFHLKQPQSTFIVHLIATGIVPQHAYGPNYRNAPIGSGPFQFVQWDRGQQLIVEANPNYYGNKPFFQRLTFLFLGEDAAFAAAKSGLVNAAYIPAAFSRQAVPGMRLVNLRSVDNRGIAFPVVSSGGQTESGAPIGNDVTADAAIRKAVNVAVDRQALVEGILEGYGTPAYSASDGLPWWNEETVFTDADPQEAGRILDEAGWQDRDGDGVREKDGLKAEFALLYPAGDVTRQSLALAAADMVKAAGIRIRVEGKSWEDIRHRMHADAVLFGWGSHDPLEIYNLYSSRYRGVEYYNPGYYGNPAVDEWLDKALLSASEEEAIPYWKKAQWDGKTGASMQGDAPWAWLVNIDHLYLVDEKLDIGRQRIQPHGHGWPVTDNIAEWRWFD